MAKFEPTIEESARESSLKTSQPETSDVGVRSSEIRSTENEDKESGKTMNREDALRKLREIIGKDQRYDMDGSEVNQIRNIIEECSSKDSLILLMVFLDSFLNLLVMKRDWLKLLVMLLLKEWIL